MIRNGYNALWKPTVGVQIDRTNPAVRGLRALWLCNENTGNMLYDIFGSYHFALTGGVSRLAEPQGPDVKFDGLSGQGIASGHPLSGLTEFTVILRLRQKNGLSSPYGPYLGSEQGFTSGVNINSNNPSFFDFIVGTSTLTVAVVNDAWGVYALQWSNATGIMRSYTNGLLSGNLGGVNAVIPTYLNTYIGKASAPQLSYLTDSQISSMKVYDRFLTSTDIMSDYSMPYSMFTARGVRRLYEPVPPPSLGGKLQPVMSMNSGGVNTRIVNTSFPTGGG